MGSLPSLLWKLAKMWVEKKQLSILIDESSLTHLIDFEYLLYWTHEGERTGDLVENSYPRTRF